MGVVIYGMVRYGCGELGCTYWRGLRASQICSSGNGGVLNFTNIRAGELLCGSTLVKIECKFYTLLQTSSSSCGRAGNASIWKWTISMFVGRI